MADDGAYQIMLAPVSKLCKRAARLVEVGPADEEVRVAACSERRIGIVAVRQGTTLYQQDRDANLVKRGQNASKLDFDEAGDYGLFARRTFQRFANPPRPSVQGPSAAELICQERFDAAGTRDVEKIGLESRVVRNGPLCGLSRQYGGCERS